LEKKQTKNGDAVFVASL